jgi:acylglycerol lipase
MIFQVNDKESLYYTVREPVGETLGCVVIIHGYAEHGGRYEQVSDLLSDAGFKVYMPDLPGHGKSSGKKGLVKSADKVVESVRNFINFIKKENSSLKIFIFGHSMGGALSLVYSARFGSDIAGVITSGAAVHPLPFPPYIIRKLITFIAFYFPAFKTLPLDTEKISTIADIVEKYKNDSLNYNGRVMAKTASELFRLRILVKKIAVNIIEPILLLHGSDDELASPSGSKIVYDLVSSEDKQILFYDKSRHEILNDIDGIKVAEDIKNWLLERV